MDQSRVALLADVAQGGCRLCGIGLPKVGTDVLLKVADVELFGQIVWKRDEERGVKFDEPLSDTDWADLRVIITRHNPEGTSSPDIIAPEGRRKPSNDPMLGTRKVPT